MTNRSRLSADTSMARCEGILDAQVDQEIVALSVEKGMCYGLNAVGARIWRLIERPIRIRAVCEVLTREFAVEPNICEGDVLALLEELLAEGLIETCESRPECDVYDIAGAIK